MSSDPKQNPQPEADAAEKQLCTGCMTPNEPSEHFCAKCGAPLSSYAFTGPFEHLFAEGYTYRQAAERPRSLIVVLGIWLIFGAMALAGAVLVFLNQAAGIGYAALGAFMISISVVLIWKTTLNYLAREKTIEKPDSPPDASGHIGT